MVSLWTFLKNWIKIVMIVLLGIVILLGFFVLLNHSPLIAVGSVFLFLTGMIAYDEC